MKRTIQIMTLLICILSCTNNKIDPVNSKDEANQDTIPVVYTRYDWENIEGKKYYYKLVIESISDSLTKFFYFKDTSIKIQVDYQIKVEEFDKNHNADLLEKVDTIELNINNELFRLMKYEEIAPPIDGEGCDIFSEKYGFVASASYSWGGKLILTKWGDETFPLTLKDSLLADNVRYLKRNKIPAPPSIEELERFSKILEEVEKDEILEEPEIK